MPAFFLRILYSLLRRKFLAYPTLEELREHRREIAQSEMLGEQLQIRLSSTSSSNIMEAWKIFRALSKPKKDSRAKAVSTKKAAVQSRQKEKREVNPDYPSSDVHTSGDEATVLDNPEESKEESDFKRSLLFALQLLAKRLAMPRRASFECAERRSQGN